MLITHTIFTYRFSYYNRKFFDVLSMILDLTDDLYLYNPLLDGKYIRS